MPLPALAAGSLGSVLVRVVQVYLIAKAGQFVLNILAFFGLAWATYEYVVGPAVAQVQSLFTGLPADLIAWLGFFRVDVVATMLLSAYAIVVAKRVFLSRSA